MNQPHKLVLALALAFFSATAFSAGMEIRGRPAGSAAALGTYGMGVPARTALKSIVPSGWKVYIHQSVKLPETLDWSISDTWVSALDRFSQTADLSVALDWDAHTVMVRTADIAVQEAATRQEIALAALTPLPKFSADAKPAAATPAPVASDLALSSSETAPTSLASVEPIAVASSTPQPVAASVPAMAAVAPSSPVAPEIVASAVPSAAVAAPVVVAPVPVIRTNPTPVMVAAQKADAQSRPAPRLASTTDFSYTQPVAFNKPSARKVVQAIATKYNLRVVWALADDHPLRGPVTLLADNASQDLELLKKAMGRGSSAVLEYSEEESVIRAFKVGSARPITVPVDPVMSSWAAPLAPSFASPKVDQAGTPAEVGSEPTPFAQSGATNAAAAASAEPKPTAAPVPLLRLAILAAQPLEDALTKFVRDQGYTLEWQIEGGFEAGRALAYEGATLSQVLIQVLPPLGLSADIYTRDKHIVIRPGDTRN